MPKPTVAQIEQVLRRAASEWTADRPLPADTRTLPPPVSAPVLPEGDLDVEAIGRASAQLPANTSADRLIEDALRAAGIRGTWSDSREYRELWFLCVLARESYLENAA